jgi:hypothetical protein
LKNTRERSVDRIGIAHLTYYGAIVDVLWRELRKLLASSKGDIVIGRKLRGDELKLYNGEHASPRAVIVPTAARGE